MANVTDPLARSVHGKDPQNLIEYITRQKIYDSLYWKEECFGLSASDVATKATSLKALGGPYGGNNKPTRFLCLCLKMLQIQPEEGIVEEFLQNEDFKYLRALGAFYLRLTGRPAEIYELIEPLYNDFRKLRFRESTGWKITYMDELADELLTSDRYCGIALPHLPKRDVLVTAGYLDGPRRSALTPLIEEQMNGDAEKFLQNLAEQGNAAAITAMDERKRRKEEEEEKEKKISEQRMGHNMSRDNSRDRDDRDMQSRYGNGGHRRGRDYDDRDRGYYGDERHRDDRYDGSRPREYGHDRYPAENEDERRHHKEERRKERKEKKKSKGDKKYGSLFKKTEGDDTRSKHEKDSAEEGTKDVPFEESNEYWNAERAKLGLKPLKD